MWLNLDRACGKTWMPGTSPGMTKREYHFKLSGPKSGS
jgi:hypothetical protein